MADTQANNIEVDDFKDSDYESVTSEQSETQSTTSSLHTYLVENGRRYHVYYGPDKNPMPADEAEQDRLDIYHEIALILGGGELYKAPLDKDNIHRVLDLGTGTGIWAIDFANDHPQAEVYGVDISPIQPTWVPPNCRFEVDDIELEWTYRNSFDFIHSRAMLQSINDWPKLVKSIKANLKPGGWIELGELVADILSDDNTVPDDWAPKIAYQYFNEALEKVGRVTKITAPWLQSLLEDAGFVDVGVHVMKQPLGPWPKNKALKQAGALHAVGTETSYHAYGLALFTRVLGFSPEKAQKLCDDASAAHLERKSGVHAYVPYIKAYGRKPFDEPKPE